MKKTIGLYSIFVVIMGTLILLPVFLSTGCRSIPCTSVDALKVSYEVFLEDHFNYVDADTTLSDEAKEIIRRHALAHKELIDELAILCESVE